MDKKYWGVHIHHCCVIHGCKYMDLDCPVVLKQVKQDHLCEDCDDQELLDQDDLFQCKTHK